MSGSSRVEACDDCLRRTDLVAAVAGHLDVQWRRRDGTLARVLALPDDALVGLDASGVAARRYARFSATDARERCALAGIGAVCRCRPGYPGRVRDLADPPAVLHVLGRLEALHEVPAVSVVGARRCTSYGLEVARALGRGLAVAGVPVVSGLALGVDAASHVGALERRPAAPPVAVLAGAVERPYPASHRHLHGRVAEAGCVVSELPPGFTARRWCFVARNRIIAALGDATVVVEAAERSGSLTTAGFAEELGRTVAAVPGQVTSRLAAGTNALLAAGAALVTDPRDVLDLVLGVGGTAESWDTAAVGGHGVPLGPGGPRACGAFIAPGVVAPQDEVAEPELRALLAAVEDGRATLAALAASPAEAEAVARRLTELELRGLVRRDFGGRYIRVA